MDAGKNDAPGSMNNRTTVERKSEREVVVTRTFDAPARQVFEAWTTPALFRQWWVPKSCGATLVSCDMDVRTGGGYRLVFGHPDAPEPMAFFGRYIEVTPPARLVWTNEESDTGAVTTVTFEGMGGRTLVVLHERYPSKEALDAAIGAAEGMPEQLEQLDELLATPAK